MPPPALVTDFSTLHSQIWACLYIPIQLQTMYVLCAYIYTYKLTMHFMLGSTMQNVTHFSYLFIFILFRFSLLLLLLLAPNVCILLSFVCYSNAQWKFICNLSICYEQIKIPEPTLVSIHTHYTYTHINTYKHCFPRLTPQTFQSPDRTVTTLCVFDWSCVFMYVCVWKYATAAVTFLIRLWVCTSKCVCVCVMCVGVLQMNRKVCKKGNIRKYGK